MTKSEFKKQLSVFDNWAEQVRKDLEKHTSLPKGENDEIRDENSLREAAGKVKDPPSEEFLRLIGQGALVSGGAASVTGQLPAVALRAEPEPERIQLQNFLKQMSTAVVDAQSMLDAKSAEYLAATAGKPHILPSVFRVPKLTAQMKFALEVEQGKQVNLLFYKRDEKTTSRNEQGIDFDVVSVPAPPGATDALGLFGPRLDLLLDPLERERVLDAVKQGGLADVTKIADEAPKRLLILSLPVQKDRSEYLVLGTGEKDISVGLWRLIIPPAGPPKLENIYPLNRKNAPNEDVFKQIVEKVANLQEEFFTD